MTITARQAERSEPATRHWDGLTIAILVVTLFGLADAAYLTYVHYQGFQALLCVGAHHGHSSCQTVQSSTYAELAGVPVALLGLIGYVVLLVTLPFRGDLARVVGFGVALIGLGFSAYLTYREIFTIKAICEWCVASAICMAVLTILTAVRFLRGDPTAA